MEFALYKLLLLLLLKVELPEAITGSSGCLENSDPKDKTNLHSVCRGSCLLFVDTMSYPEPAEKIKRLAVEDTCTDRKNNIQHSYQFLVALLSMNQIQPQRFRSHSSQRYSKISKREVRCVTVSQPNDGC